MCKSFGTAISAQGSSTKDVGARGGAKINLDFVCFNSKSHSETMVAYPGFQEAIVSHPWSCYVVGPL